MRAPLERPVLPALLFAAALPLALLLVKAPFISAGVLFGSLLLAAVLLHPLAVIGAMLLVGPIDLSFVTGGFKSLLAGMGGLDMNGIRLIGVSVGLAFTIVLIPATRRVLFGRYAIVYVLFLAFAALTLIRSPNPVDGMRLLLKIAYPLLFFVLIAGLATERRQLDRLVDCALIGAALIALLLNPLYALAGGYHSYDTGYVRIRGVGIHENPFSFYLLIALYIAFARFALRGQWRYLALCAALGTWLALTLTRITFLAGAVGLLGLAAYGTIATRRWRVLLGAAAIALAVGVPLLPVVLERSVGFVPSLPELISLLRSPVALYDAIDWQGRELAWPIIIAAFLAQPWTGLGLGSSIVVMREHFPPQVGALVHNEYLRLAVETGVIGVVLFAAAIVIWFVAVLKADRHTGGAAREFTLPALAGLLSWSIIAITDNSFDYYAPYTQFIGLLVGCCVAAAAIRSREERAPEPSP